MRIGRLIVKALALDFLVTREHQLVVKAKAIIIDFYSAREESPIISDHFYAKCALRLSGELIRQSSKMDGLKIFEVYHLINHISMMCSTQQLRITAANMAETTEKMQDYRICRRGL